MNNLKFRAWDKVEKVMKYFAYGIFNRVPDGIEDLTEPMQYIRLNDKNGKEIYEGDICTANWYDYDEPNHTTTGIIEFCEGWIAYWLADYESETFEELNGHGCYYWDIEVIGNIYENPELLEVQG